MSIAKRKQRLCKYCNGTESFLTDRSFTRWGVRCKLSPPLPIRSFDTEEQAQHSIDEWCTGDGRLGCRPYLLQETGHSYSFSGDLRREFEAMEEATVAKIDVPKPNENTCPYYQGIETKYSPKGYCIDCVVCHGFDRTPYDLKSWALDAVTKLCLNESTYSTCQFFKQKQEKDVISQQDTPPELPVPQETAPIVAAEQRNITDVTAEIRYYKAQTVSNIIEIGKRLIEAKELLAHGLWGEWLENSVEFSHETANRFMRLATEYSNSSALTNLNYTQLVTLLTLPADDRDDFIETTHVVDGEEKTVSDMSTRELQRVIKERDEAIKRAEQAESTVDSKQKSVLSWQAEAQSQTEKNRLLKDENRRQGLDIARLESQPIDVAVQQPTEAQLEAMREEIRDELRNEFADNAPPETYLSKKALENADGNFYDAVIGAEALLLGVAGQMDVKRAEQVIDNCVSILEGIVNRFRKKKDLLMEMDRRINPDSYDVDF